MHDLNSLTDILILLGASVFIVVFMKKFKLSPVLGYLIVGTIIGTNGFKLITDQEAIQVFGEFGVIFLLFVIGLELTFERLIQMRLHVFGFGGLQLLITTGLFYYITTSVISVDFAVAILISAALSLSSTAIVLQVLAETKRQSSQVGRLSLSVLLMQDFAVVPLLAILPLLSNSEEAISKALGIASLKALAVIIMITVVGRVVLRPFFTLIGSVKSDEVYVSTTLLLVIGAATLTSELGLSTAMGAFIAGILIAETEYRNKVENSILPFKSLFLGLFFMAVGMSIDIHFIQKNLVRLLCFGVGLMVIKAIVIFILCKIFKFFTGASVHSAILLSQCSEFAFVLFGIASKSGVIEQNTAQFLLMMVAISMAITPLFALIGAHIEEKLDIDQDLDPTQEFKGVSDLNGHILIAGFGRVGRTIAYMLSKEQINYVAVDSNFALVKQARSKGYPVYHGDLSKLEILKAVGAERASGIIITMSDKVGLRKTVKAASSNYRHLNIISRSEDHRHGKQLRKLGADETISSTIETGLQLGVALFKNIGISENEMTSLKESMRKDNYSILDELELFSGVARHSDEENKNTAQK